MYAPHACGEYYIDVHNINRDAININLGFNLFCWLLFIFTCYICFQEQSWKPPCQDVKEIEHVLTFNMFNALFQL